VTARPHRVSALVRGGLRALAVLLAGTAWGVHSAALQPEVPAAATVAAARPAARSQSPDGPGALAATRRLLALGTPALALRRIERTQRPGERWAEWETLRLAALQALGLWHAIAVRAEALPARSPLPGPFLRSAWLAGAEAALRMPTSPAGPALARTLAARVIWSEAPTADELRLAQVVVIESLFTGGTAPAGYRSILRFRQDAPVLDAATGVRFLGLIALHGTPSDAVPLLPLLADTHPVRIALQAKLGLVAPPEASARVRAALQARDAATVDPVRDWRVLRSAAHAIGDPQLAIEAMERLLDADPSADGAAVAARSLWREYLAAAPVLANRQQLLAGDAPGWSDAAARLAARDPGAARTLFAYLAVSAPVPAARETARLQFTSLLREAGLGRVAVHLFLDPESAGAPALGADLRRLLGATAAAHRMWPQAAELLHGLAPRAGEDAQAWSMATAELQARAGRFEDAVASTRAAVPGRPDLVSRAHALADLLEDAGDAAAAAGLREAVGPVPGPALRPAPAPRPGPAAAPRRP
jgi:tetratricopeptide (TPR) repeat protein